ncbi:MAG: helicase C-terminal domain-containing protein [Streptomycetaceae bacterium]|nr:helicase C-terminal domain-containing protein [Streptomycetaceae bacterium]
MSDTAEAVGTAEAAEAAVGSAAPRTLAEDLRRRGDDAVAALLRLRPDLLTPVPADLTQLATRAGTRASVVRALERLDRFTLQAAEALAIAPDPCPYGTLLALLSGDDGAPDVAEALPCAVAALRRAALLWGGDDRLHLVRTARDLLTPMPTAPSATGLGPTVAEATAGMSPGRLQEILAAAGLPPTHDPVSAVTALTALFRDRARMSALLADAPEGTAAILDKLTWGPPYGKAVSASTPVRWLLARGVLLPAGPGNLVLPREAALHLRRGLAHRKPEPLPPVVAPSARHEAATVNATAASQAFTAVQTVEELLKSWDAGGPPVLRAGGMSVRDLKRTAIALDVDEPVAAFWLETAYAAGLLASDGEADERYAPTPRYDEWLRLPTEERWAALAAAWLPATRSPGLVGGRDAKGRALSVLGSELDRSFSPEVRRQVLRLLAALDEGASAAPEALLARLRWERPLRGTADTVRAQLVQWTLQEAELLGVTGRGALSAHGRALQDTGQDPGHGAGQRQGAAEATRRLAPLLPEQLDHILLQADLTAVAPGPLRTTLAETLGVLADIESKGGATVYRFTPDSVRRALDAGRTAEELHTFLAAHSRTPVPQPLTYLIDDVARRHGRLRVGAASAYLRCDDDALLTEILADRRAAGLGLRRLAPTVLATHSSPDVLLERLRSMGFAPAAESADGDMLITRPDAYRTPPRSAPVPVPEGPPVPDETLLGAAVKAIRAGERAATAVRKPVPHSAGARLPRTTSAETLATLQAAVLKGEALWIGYVNADGAASQRVIEPVRVEGGFITAFDHTADKIRAFALHRITGVAQLADDPT